MSQSAAFEQQKINQTHQEKFFLLHVGHMLNGTTFVYSRKINVMSQMWTKGKFLLPLRSQTSNHIQKHVWNLFRREKKSQKCLNKNGQTQILCLQYSKLTLKSAEYILPFLSTRSQSVFNLTQF